MKDKYAQVKLIIVVSNWAQRHKGNRYEYMASHKNSLKKLSKIFFSKIIPVGKTEQTWCLDSSSSGHSICVPERKWLSPDPHLSREWSGNSMRGWFASSRIFSLGKEFLEKELNIHLSCSSFNFNRNYDVWQITKTGSDHLRRILGQFMRKCMIWTWKTRKKKKKRKGTCGPV